MSNQQDQSNIQTFGRGVFKGLTRLAFAVIAALVVTLIAAWVMVLPIELREMILPLAFEQYGEMLLVDLIAVIGWNLFITFPIAHGLWEVLNDE